LLITLLKGKWNMYPCPMIPATSLSTYKRPSTFELAHQNDWCSMHTRRY
jgi:hypothetical protein